MYDRVPEYAKLGTSQVCHEWKSVTRSWKSRIRIVGESAERSVSVIGERKMVPRCPLQLALKMTPYTPLTDQRSDESLKFVVETEIIEDRPEMITSAEKKTMCLHDASREMCLRQRVRRTLSDMVGTWKRAARKTFFSLLKYDLIGRCTKTVNGTEPGKELTKQMDEA